MTAPLAAPVVRRATAADLFALGQMAGALVRQHHRVDARRFFLVPDVEAGYQAWFGGELENEQAALLVAQRAGGPELLGYIYATVEERDWNLLLDAHGAIHDVFVHESARRGGVGRQLVDAMIAEFEGRGVALVVLSTMVQNHSAQALFRACGFGPTMLEMTRTAPR